jgi:hypothetical protein
VHVIAHEYAHVQQAPALADNKHPTVLEGSLVEGAAELTAELIAGKVAYSQVRASTEGREKEIETAFVSDLDKTVLPTGFSTARRKSRATSATGSAIVSSRPTTNVPPTSTRPFVRFWK